MDCPQLIYFSNLAFLELAVRNGINSNPANFAELAVQAMRHLQVNGKNNLLYKFAQCIATKRPGSDESLFPQDRMPFGMVEYQIEFFFQPPTECNACNAILECVITRDTQVGKTCLILSCLKDGFPLPINVRLSTDTVYIKYY